MKLRMNLTNVGIGTTNQCLLSDLPLLLADMANHRINLVLTLLSIIGILKIEGMVVVPKDGDLQLVLLDTAHMAVLLHI